MTHQFQYADERFADVQLLRYRLKDFESLPTKRKQYIYCLSQATLCGRDITTDQFGRYNLRIRKLLEAVYVYYQGDRGEPQFKALTVYLKRVWFSNGIYHHYGCEKFEPEFSSNFLHTAIISIDKKYLPLAEGETVTMLCDELFPIIFDKDLLPKRVNQADGDDLVQTSACNYYEGVSQKEAEDFYNDLKQTAPSETPSFGLNSKLRKVDGRLKEDVWTTDAPDYGRALREVVAWLQNAVEVAENDQQRRVIELLIDYYREGDLRIFDQYSIEWLQEQEGQVDFINGFIEVYGDPLGLKGSWEGIVTYKDLEASKRTRTISDNAQWFEDHSPVDPRFRKPQVKGVTANVVCAAMLGGDEYPSTAIGINLPNADWIRERYGSKSITISNLTEAYDKAAHGNGFREEFVVDQPTLQLIEQYGDLCDDLHTDLHECLGHGSGRCLPGVNPDVLKAYGSTIEEARADLFGLYYLADPKLVELGLVPNGEAYKAQYYSYMMNGLMTQLTRIKPGNNIEEAHMRNRALIAHWVLERAKGAVGLVKRGDRTFVEITDYEALRQLFAQLLAEIQRIKSEGDYEAARAIVETYAVNVDRQLHEEVLSRYAQLDIAPYKGFINPRLTPVRNEQGEIVDIAVDYTESYEHQMLRYSTEYGFM